MFKNRLAQRETYTKDIMGNYDIENSFSVYEVFIEVARDKQGEVLKNKDGSDRYYPLDDLHIAKLDKDVKVKKVRDDTYKTVYEVNNDIVEKVERDGKRTYFVVNPDKVETLEAGTQVVIRGDYYHLPKEMGMVIVDEKDIEHPRVAGVRKFKTDDHKKEAEELVKNFGKRPVRKDN